MRCIVALASPERRVWAAPWHPRQRRSSRSFGKDLHSSRLSWFFWPPSEPSRPAASNRRRRARVRCLRGGRDGQKERSNGQREPAEHETPVLESRGRIFAADRVRGKRSAACGPRVRLVQVGTAEFFSNDLEGFFGRADVAVVRIKRAFVNGKCRKQLAAVKVVLRKSGLPHPGLNFVPFLHEAAALVDFPEE